VKFFNFFVIYRQNKCIVVQYWKIERKEKLDWPWKVSVIWMHVAMSVSPRWWDLRGRNGPWGKEGRHHRSWLSGRWKGTPFSVKKSMQERNQNRKVIRIYSSKKKCSNWSRIDPVAFSWGKVLDYILSRDTHIWYNLLIYLLIFTLGAGLMTQCLYSPSPRENVRYIENCAWIQHRYQQINSGILNIKWPNLKKYIGLENTRSES
jgi:hypothetical protein